MKASSINTLLEEHSAANTPLKLCMVRESGEDYSHNFVLLEGSTKALRFLADLIYAHLESDYCELSLHPNGAGNIHLDPESTVGLVLHRLPCNLSHNNRFVCDQD